MIWSNLLLERHVCNNKGGSGNRVILNDLNFKLNCPNLSDLIREKPWKSQTTFILLQSLNFYWLAD